MIHKEVQIQCHFAQTTIRRVLKFAYEAYKKNQCKFMVTKMKNVRLIQVLFVITVRIDKIGRKVQNLSKSWLWDRLRRQGSVSFYDQFCTTPPILVVPTELSFRQKWSKWLTYFNVFQELLDQLYLYGIFSDDYFMYIVAYASI